MSERKNASHVGGKQESGNRDERTDKSERNSTKEKYQEKRMRGRKLMTDGESVTVRRNKDIKWACVCVCFLSAYGGVALY